MLGALRLSHVSYVAPSRELGIVVVVALGTLLLREPFGKGRLIGSCFILLAIALIAVAP